MKILYQNDYRYMKMHIKVQILPSVRYQNTNYDIFVFVAIESTFKQTSDTDAIKFYPKYDIKRELPKNIHRLYVLN